MVTGETTWTAPEGEEIATEGKIRVDATSWQSSLEDVAAAAVTSRLFTSPIHALAFIEHRLSTYLKNESDTRWI